MNPKEDIEKLTREIYQIIRDNTDKIRFANPTEKAQLERENEKQWKNIESLLNDYINICELLGLEAVGDIIQIATHFNNLAIRLKATQQKDKPAQPDPWGSPSPWNIPAQPAQSPSWTSPSAWNVLSNKGLEKCPYCGAEARPGDNFCLNCGNRLLPAIPSPSQSPTNNIHDDLRIPSTPGPRVASLLFRMNYHFVHQFMPKGEEKLAEFVVSFNSRGDVESSDSKAIKHICFLLDVSSSMDTPGKYDYLLQAIPYVFEELSNDDWLSIILFSTYSDLVWSKSVADCRGKSQEILRRINQSGVKFGGTYLAPGLQIAINEIKDFNVDHPKAVTRLYILTDGWIYDAEDCIYLNPQLQQLNIEVNSFGFGQDFDAKALRQIMKDCPGGRVNWISSPARILKDFHHLGEVAKKIVATDAELELSFTDNVIPADAFRFRPGRQWFGTIDDRSKRFHLSIGTLEKDRDYMYAFGARLFPTEEEHEQIATAMLRYQFQGEQHEVKQDIFVDRSSNPRRLEQIDKDIESFFLVLGSLKSNDPESLMKSYQARLDMLREEGGYEAQVQVLEKALQKLAEEGTLQSLSESEINQLDADFPTIKTDVAAPTISTGAQQDIPEKSDE